MLRNGRDGHGVESHAYAHSHSHSNTDADRHANTDADRHANTDSWAGYAWKYFDSTTSRYR